MTLDAERLIDSARQATGLADFGSDTFEVGLSELVDALVGEAALSELGRVVVEGELSGYLADRLRITADRGRTRSGPAPTSCRPS